MSLTFIGGFFIGLLYWTGWIIGVILLALFLYNILGKRVGTPVARVRRAIVFITIGILTCFYMHAISIADTWYCNAINNAMRVKEPFITVCTIGINGFDTGMSEFLNDVRDNHYRVGYIGWGYMVIEEGSLNASNRPNL